MKFLKKAVSALLASVMCIPAGILSFAEAEENTVTTVTLSDTENGFMQLSKDCMESSTASQDNYHMVQVNEDGELEQKENDGSMWAFNYGDFVEVELIPDNGFNVESFTVKAADTGDVMAEKKTMDNVFSFTMPGKSVLVEAVFARTGLTDPEAATLQEKIDSLPGAMEYYDGKYLNLSPEKKEELQEEAAELKEEYFNGLSDEQAGQVDEAGLYASLIQTELLSYGDGDRIPDEAEREELQKRIDSLPDVSEIAEPAVTEESGYAVCSYNDGNTDMKISGAETRELFLEVLDLTEEVCSLQEDYTGENLDPVPLMQMQGFFTTGAGIMTMAAAAADDGFTPFSGGYTQDYTNDQYTPKNGYYNSGGWNSYTKCNSWQMKNSMKNNSTGEVKEYSSVAYCACSQWPQEKKSGRCDFTASKQVARLNYNRGGQIRNPDAIAPTASGHFMKTAAQWKPYFKSGKVPSGDWKETGASLMIRLILWYGYKGPGYGMDDSIMTPDYATTHYALSYAYSGQTGSAAGKTKWKTFYKQCMKKYAKVHPASSKEFLASSAIAPGTIGKKKPKTVTFDNFCVYVILPSTRSAKYQHIFFYIVEDEEEEGPDPFYLAMYKAENPDAAGECHATDDAKLTGAQYTVKYYKDKEYSSVKDTEGKTPTATWTFTSKGISNGSKDFQYIACDVDCDYNGSSNLNTAGVDFGPKQDIKLTARDKWENKFIKAGDLESWRENFGKTGSYLIQETKAPAGFLIEGSMTVLNANKKISTDNPGQGIVIYMKNATSKTADTVFKVNGQDCGPGKKNPLVDVENKYSGGIFLNYEEPVSPQWETTASGPDGTQKIQLPDDTADDTETAPEPVTVTDSVTVKIPEKYKEEGVFVIKTWLLDKGIMNPETKKYEKPEEGYPCLNVTWDGMTTDDPDKGKCALTCFPSALVPKGEEGYTFQVSGTISPAGLAGHTLVFMNDIALVDCSTGEITEEVAADLLSWAEDEDYVLWHDESSEKEEKEELYFWNKPDGNEDKEGGPTGDTTAKDVKTDYHIAFPEKSVLHNDTIHYKDLKPGTQYRVESTLVDRETGQTVRDDDGDMQYLETIFVPETKDGDYTPLQTRDEKEATFIFNGSSFAGRTLVFFEEVYEITEDGDVLVFSHKDRYDEKQTIRFPDISTSAADMKTKMHVSDMNSETHSAVIVDTVTYENLVPGLTYEIRGKLIDRKKTLEAGTEVAAIGPDGKNTENTLQFTPATTYGTVDISYEVDTERYSKELTGGEGAGAVFVVYEELYVIQRYDGDDARSIVAVHKDINDKNQTIYMPFIKTELLDTQTGMHIMYADYEGQLKDTVSYYNCEPGQTFYVSGRLIDMKTGKVLKDSSGKEVKTDYRQVTASASGNGTWELVYDIDASSLAGTTVVAYAEVYVRGGTGAGGYTEVANHDDFMDKNERVYIPHISTTLLDQKTDSHYALAEKNAVLYDTVHYENILPGGYTYKLETELVDQATEMLVTDDSGRRLSLTTEFKADFDMRDGQYGTYGDIIPQNYEGSGITFNIDGEYFDGRSLVCYERMYIKSPDGGWQLVADHEELLDAEQTVHFGKAWTEALDSATKTQTGKAGKNTKIVDTFYYQNLKPGYTYELKGKVVEKKSTISTKTDVVVAENTVSGLVPDAPGGAWHNSFTLDTSKYDSKEYCGTVLVVYEELYQVKRYDGSDDRLLIASEENVNCAAQTIWYPYIETELTDSVSGTHVLSAEKDRILTDAVTYHNMQPGTAYTLSGRLVDMQTGKVLTDSSGRRIEKTMEVMSTDNGDGTWNLEYSIDASGLAGKTIVAFADVYIKNGEDETILSPVAEHRDFWDGAERVYVPAVSTVATDQKTNSHLSFGEDNMWITDRVYYSNLQPDTDYRLVSTLVDKETGEVVTDDKKVLQRTETDFNTKANTSQEKYVQIISNPFTDSSDTGIGYAYGYVVPGDGTVLPDGEKPDGIVFTLDGGTFEGRTLVIYEELQMYTADDEWVTVAKHMDINDENQTIHVPKVRTKAVDSETLTHISKADGSVTVIDTVTYENLLPGMTYVVEGKLMDKLRDDKKSSTAVRDADGHEITGSVTFTPEKPDGTVKVVFQGDAGKFQTDEGEFSSDTLVVFEELYLLNSKDAGDDRLKVAEHCDINDENQTIYFPRSKTKAVAYDLDGNPKQGDADHVNGYAVFECTYCRKTFLTQKEAQNHIDGTVLCRNKGAAVKAVSEYTLYDTLYYENLIPGRTYQVVGTLVDTATGKAVLKGHTAVQSDTKYFTPGDRNGEVDAQHKDLADSQQTIQVGGMYTVVYDKVLCMNNCNSREDERNKVRNQMNKRERKERIMMCHNV